LSFEEDKAESLTPTAESSSLESIEHVVPALTSPLLKREIDEEVTILQPDISDVKSPCGEQAHHTKTEKGSSEEGFCCVMSMHDGVVL
jgi:hypothetical protein